LLWVIVCSCATPPPAVPPLPLPQAEGAMTFGESFYRSPRTPERVRKAALNYEAAAQRPEQAAEGLWKAARAYVWLTQFAGSKRAQQEQDVARAIALARRAVATAPKQANAHYYLAASLGLFSQLHSAMSQLEEMAREGKRAAELDPRIDHAGPYRLLGSLYGQAPDPPISLGDEEKGLDYLRKAVTTAPDNPENHFRLAELLAAMGQKAEAKHQLEQAFFLNETDADPTETLAWQTQAKRLWEKMK
jgi:tetratricopeptide (TPR) repeat protein